MRIIIEVDSNNQTGITTSQSGSEKQPDIIPTSLTNTGINAGIAKISAPDFVSFAENETAASGIDAAMQDMKAGAIDAGAFNSNHVDEGGNTIMSSHQNYLAAAVSSGSAIDAGGAMVAADGTLTSQATAWGASDRSNSLSAGEFSNTEII